MCSIYYIVLLLAYMYSVQFALSCGVTAGRTLTGTLGTKAVLTSEMLPLLNGHFKVYVCADC